MDKEVYLTITPNAEKKYMKEFEGWSSDERHLIFNALLQSLDETFIVEAIVDTFGKDYATHEFVEKMEAVK